MSKILLAENDLNLQAILKSCLQAYGHQVWAVARVSRVMQLLAEINFDLLILDRFLLDGDLYAQLPYLALKHLHARTLIISQENNVTHKIRGFDLAVNDILAKPFTLAEFQLRVKNLLNLEKIYQFNKIQLGSLFYHPDTGLVEDQDLQAIFCPKEKILFDCLYQNRKRIVSRDYLISLAWGNELIPQNNTLDVYIRRIRMKLFTQAKKLETIKRIGYRLWV